MNLPVLILIFVATLVCSILSTLYQKLVIDEEHFKASFVITIHAALALVIWKFCLKDSDLTESFPAICSYLSAEFFGTFSTLKLSHKKV